MAAVELLVSNWQLAFNRVYIADETCDKHLMETAEVAKSFWRASETKAKLAVIWLKKFLPMIQDQTREYLSTVVMFSIYKLAGEYAKDPAKTWRPEGSLQRGWSSALG